MKPEEILRQYFGYESFRPGQKEIITAILKHRDALAIMPTGAGKSVCYQVPAMMLDGITIVISPLISLMQDQVKALKEAGIRAAYINSSLNEAQIRKALQNAAEGMYRIVYVAPERLQTAVFRRFAAKAKIAMVTVDEAHCISQWGQDFRPSYQHISDFIESLDERPVVSAFTATATEQVREDILTSLQLENPRTVVTGYDRPNLYFGVEHAVHKSEYVLDYVKAHKKDSGIIYCSTRKNADQLYEKLKKAGIRAGIYHAGLDPNTRKQNQEDFVYDRIRVICATNAFGMGIDKSNVRYVLHYNMPQSMENYYQEAGRAGRDGEPGECILLYSPQDVIIDQFLLEHKDFSDVNPDDIEAIRQKDRQRLAAMEHYCTTASCLRCCILEYFGEKTGKPCGNCSSCSGTYTETDVSMEARAIVSCILEGDERYGSGTIAGILIGANRARLKEIDASRWDSFGMLKNTNEADLKGIISALIEEHYLMQSDDQYRILKTTEKARKLRDPLFRIQIRLAAKKTEPSRKPAKTKGELTGVSAELFEELRYIRSEIAGKRGIPPYVVFTDRTLTDMAAKVPVTKKEMLEVSGVAAKKYEQYGKVFLKEIKAFVEFHPEARKGKER